MSSGSKSQTVGYRYYMGLLMGLCRGPIDSLKQINVGGKRAWPLAYIIGGNQLCRYVSTKGAKGALSSLVCTNRPPSPVDEPLPLTESGISIIGAPNLFGGDEGEGGIEGRFELMMGESTQNPSPGLAKLIPGLRSALRGIVTIYYNGLISSFNPYPKVWSFRVTRSSKGWADNNVFYPSKVKIELTGDHPTEGPVRNKIEAMNPAHMIYECATNPDWGRGLPATLIDAASFMYAADILYTEKFGLCMPWSRQDQIGVFIQTVMDHIGGLIYVSRETGLVTLKLVRDDYDIDELPVFTIGEKGGILSITEDDDGSVSSLCSEVIVKYTDAVTGDDGMVRSQNIAAMEAASSIISKTVDYPGIPCAALANRVSQRDLRVNGTPLRRLTVTLNRRAWRLAPGAVIRVVDPTRRLTGQVFRVGKIVDSAGGVLTATIVQDVFGLSASSMMGVVPPVPEPSKDPVPVVNQRSVEASYLDVYRNFPTADLPLLSEDATYLMLLGQRPGNFALNFGIYTGTDSGGYSIKGSGDWSGTATISSAITKRSDQVFLGNIAEAASITAGQAAIIDNEYIRIDDFDIETGLLSFSRGCADTVPQPHAAGARIWFHYIGSGVDTTAYAQGQTIKSKELTNTSSGQLHPSLATQMTTTFVNRQVRPYPPGNVTVNGILYYATRVVQPGFTIQWAGRNRLTQQDILIGSHEGEITSEVGTTYTIRVTNSDTGSIIRQVSGITANSWQYTLSLWRQDGAIQNLNIELFSVRDGYVSYQSHQILLNLIPQTGWSGQWGKGWNKGLAGTYPADGTAFLLRGDGANGGTKFPEYLGHSYLASGIAETRTDLSPFGTAWIRLGADSDIRYQGKIISGLSEWDFASGNKTAEARIRPSFDSSECTIVELVGYDDSRGWRFWVAPDGSLRYGRRFLDGDGIGQVLATPAGSVSRNATHHVAVTRQGNNTRLFIDGALSASGAVTTQTAAEGGSLSGILAIGGPVSVGEMRIEEVRINTITALYTATFTPPSAAFADPV